MLRFCKDHIWKLLAAKFFVKLMLLTIILGCHQSSTKVLSEKESLSRVVERGPVRVTTTIKPVPARLSDELSLSLIIDYEPGVTVHKPSFGESLGDFFIRDFHELPLRVVDQHNRLETVYTLEPTAAGKTTIAPLSITFIDSRPGESRKEHTVETETITVEIVTAAATDAPSLTQLRPPASAVEVPPPLRSWHGWALALLVAAAILAIVVWRRRRRKLAALPPPTPRELAERELRELLAKQLAQRDVKLFYVELTAVVRRFIERTTGIRAPEQTTEEFLRETSHRNTFAYEEGQRLKSFLESADLVKFAGHQPHPSDIEESILRARAFVGLAAAATAAEEVVS